MRGLRQAAALAITVLVLLAVLALAGVASADEGEQEAAAAAPLQPTQVVAEIPEGYNQLFPLQWGGGSLYQLKMRLATMGCIANTIWNYDDDRWHGYNQYNVPSTLNADWLAAYGEFVPAGSLYATCFDICEFSYFEAPRGGKPCGSLAEMRAREEWDGLHRYPIDDSIECTDDFDERVKERVLPLMPLYPGVCIFRPSGASAAGHAGPPLTRLSGALAVYPYWPSYVVVYQRTPPHPEPEFGERLVLRAEIHELCHTNQHYHFIEQMQPDRLIIGTRGTTAKWRTTRPGSSFIDLVGFTQDAAGDWSLPDAASEWAIPGGNGREHIYGTDEPHELAAELCMLYFVDRMGERSIYDWLGEDFDSTRYLTDEIVEWIETWVALPEIAAAGTD